MEFDHDDDLLQDINEFMTKIFVNERVREYIFVLFARSFFKLSRASLFRE